MDGLEVQALIPCEREVMELVVSGMSNKQVAFRLGRSEVTVKIHRGRVLRELRTSKLERPHDRGPRADTVPRHTKG